jgi:hypothetical protein
MSTVQGGQGNIITNGLVLNLDAANPRSYDYPYNGTIWNDLSGNGNNGTLINGVGYNSSNGGSLVFDGVNDYISTTTNLGTNPIPSHTISVWVKTSVASGKKIIGIENQQIGTTSNIYDRHIYVGTNGRFYYGVYDTTNRLLVSNSSLVDGVWHNIVGICTGNNQIFLYVDSILNSFGVGNSYALYGSSYIRIGSYALGVPGGWANSANGYFTGQIANAQIYNRALSSQEVLQNYNATRARFGV